MESKKYNKLVKITKKKQIHRYREQANGEREAAKGQHTGWGVRGINY